MSITFSDAFTARFWAHVDRGGPDECWPWMGARSRGYGAVRVPGLGQAPAHRVAFALRYGWWPAGMDTHHACANPSCVNPEHLIACTRADHLALHGLPRPVLRRHRAACRRGHPLVGDNVYLAADGGRRCRTCKLAATARWHARAA